MAHFYGMVQNGGKEVILPGSKIGGLLTVARSSKHKIHVQIFSDPTTGEDRCIVNFYGAESKQTVTIAHGLISEIMRNAL